MTKIEQYNKTKNNYEKIRRNIKKVLGQDSSDNDKYTLSLKRTSNVSDRGTKVILFGRYGHYGCSLSYNALDETIVDYLCAAFDHHAEQIGQTAVELAKQDMEKACLAAREEAKKILETTLS